MFYSQKKKKKKKKFWRQDQIFSNADANTDSTDVANA